MQYDRRFLDQLVRKHNRLTYAHLTLLRYDTEEPIEDMEGYIVDGSLSVDGSSALRRTCSLTISVKNPEASNYSWGLYNKFKLELGMNNDIDSKYPPIIWFPFGVFIFTEYSTNTSTNNFQISVKGQDKMCLLNGTVGGKLTGIGHRFDIEEIEDSNGAIITKKIPVKTIIREAVHTFAREPYKNIVINDIDDYGYNIIRSHLEGRTWVLVPVDIKGNLSVQVVAEVDRTGIEVLIENKFFKTWIQDKNQYNKDGFLCDNKGNLIIVRPLHQSHTSSNPDLDGKNQYMLRLLANGPEELVGYDSEALVYPTELTANVGETLTSVLDKIKKILIDFEYFYDVQGRFVFQRKRTYVTRPFSREIKDGVGQSYILPAAIKDDIAYSFDDQELIVSFNESPKLSNIKNDFSVWGADENKNPFLYRFAIDSKPMSYTTIEVSEKEAKAYKEKYYPYDTDIELKAQKSFPFDTTIPIVDSLGNRYVTWDWRELIYQMAQDQYKWGRLPDFEQRVAAANPTFYPLGRTGYEQYYVDILGLWHKVYNPWLFLTMLDDGTLHPRLSNLDITTDLVTGEKISQEEQDEINNFNFIVTENIIDEATRAKSCFLKNLSKTPFWFELSNSNGSEIDKFSVGRIGDRAEVVKEDTISFMFPLDVPQIVFYRNNIKPQGRFGGIPYKTLVSDKYFYGGSLELPGISFTSSTVTSKELKEINAEQRSLFEKWRDTVVDQMSVAFWKWKHAINNDEAEIARNDYTNIQQKALDYIVQFRQLIERFGMIIRVVVDRFKALYEEAVEKQNKGDDWLLNNYEINYAPLINAIKSNILYDDYYNGLRDCLDFNSIKTMDHVTNFEEWVQSIENYYTLEDLKGQILTFINLNFQSRRLNSLLQTGIYYFDNIFTTKNYNGLLFIKTGIKRALASLQKQENLGKTVVVKFNNAKEKLKYVTEHIKDEPFVLNGISYSNMNELATSTFSKINDKIFEYCKACTSHQEVLYKEWQEKKDGDAPSVHTAEENRKLILFSTYYDLGVRDERWEIWKQVQDDILKMTSRTLTYLDIIQLKNRYYQGDGFFNASDNTYHNFNYQFKEWYDFTLSSKFWNEHQAGISIDFFNFLNTLEEDYYSKSTIEFERIDKDWIQDVENRLNKLFTTLLSYNRGKRKDVSWLQAMVQMPTNDNKTNAYSYLKLDVVIAETQKFPSFRLNNLALIFQDNINAVRQEFLKYDSLVSTFNNKVTELISILPQSTSYSFEELVEKAKIKDWDKIKKEKQLIQGFNYTTEAINEKESLDFDKITKRIEDNETRAENVVNWFSKNFQQNNYDIEGYIGSIKSNIITTEGIFEKVNGQVSAKEKIDELITKYTYSGAIVSLTTVPIYHLEPNTRISITNKITRTSNEYLITQMSIPLGSKGTMTISATLAPPSSLKEE